MPNTFSSQQRLTLLDYTLLDPDAPTHAIETLCAQSVTPLGTVAAICVYPCHVKTVFQQRDPRIRIASVANFPAGTQSIETTLMEIENALSEGADEIDVVFPYTAYLASDDRFVQQALTAFRQACGKAILKIILETGALITPDHIRTATQYALDAGADFIKTSTGKQYPGATLEAAEVILSLLTQYPHIGFKASGGIRTSEQANTFLQLATTYLGNTFIHPKTFRLGASRLLD